MTFKQEFLETVLGNSCVKQMLKKPKGFLLIGWWWDYSFNMMMLKESQFSGSNQAEV